MGALDPYLIKKIMNQFLGGVGEDEEDLSVFAFSKQEKLIKNENKSEKNQVKDKKVEQFSTKINLRKELERYKQKRQFTLS